MARRFSKQSEQWPEKRAFYPNDNAALYDPRLAPVYPPEATRAVTDEDPRGHNRPSSAICPACERGEIKGGICNYCHTPEQPAMRTDWLPEQVEFGWPERSSSRLSAAEHNTVPCPVCGGKGRVGGKAPCSKCNGKGVIKDWGGSTLDALEHSSSQRTAEGPSLPPQDQIRSAPPPQVYNPEAYNSVVEGMHPAAQYSYERALQQGANPEAAYQEAQAKQQEMAQRAQQGQNVQGVQIPVIEAKADDVNKNPLAEIIENDFDGFVPEASISRTSHLLS